MSLQTRSVPSGCRECGSECIQENSDYGENFMVCYDCGILFPKAKEEDVREVTACIMKCPHCESIDAITIWGGEEHCNICGLDPNDPEPSARALSHLWRSRTPDMDEDKLIRELMLISNANGEDRFPARSSVGNFLRTSCGPHCVYASQCPQTTKNLARCYKEDRLEGEEEEDMSKRGRGKGKKKIEKARRKEEKKIWNQLHSRAWLFAPPKGWFVSMRNYESETIYQDQSSTGGDQSGT